MILGPSPPHAVVTLLCTIVKEIDGRICFRVDPELADAPQFGFRGELWLARRQCREVIEARTRGQHDVVRIDYALAVAKQALHSTERRR